MRNALILLVVVALIIVALGAANSSIAFDFDLVFASWSAVSLVWVAIVVAVVVLAAGLAAAWLARSDALRTTRKLESELQATYERLRAAESALPMSPAPASGPPPGTPAAPEPPAATGTAEPRDPAPPAAEAPADEASPAVAGDVADPAAG